MTAKKPIPTSYVCEPCKSAFSQFKDFKEHNESTTHLLEVFRFRVNVQISVLEEQIWMREK